MTQLTLEDAMLAVKAAAPQKWKEAIHDLIYELARGGLEFTADDVWNRAQFKNMEMPPEPRALGAMMQDFRNRGLIKPLEKWQQSTRKVCHKRPLRVWVGNICAKPVTAPIFSLQNFEE
jgi:hypothetical protein